MPSRILYTAAVAEIAGLPGAFAAVFVHYALIPVVAASLVASAPDVPSSADVALLAGAKATSLVWAGSSSPGATSSSTVPSGLASSSAPSCSPIGMFVFAALDVAVLTVS